MYDIPVIIKTSRLDELLFFLSFANRNYRRHTHTRIIIIIKTPFRARLYLHARIMHTRFPQRRYFHVETCTPSAEVYIAIHYGYLNHLYRTGFEYGIIIIIISILMFGSHVVDPARGRYTHSESYARIRSHFTLVMGRLDRTVEYIMIIIIMYYVITFVMLW